MCVPITEAQLMATNLRRNHKDGVPAFIAYNAMAQHLNDRVKQVVQSKTLSDKKKMKDIKRNIKSLKSLLDYESPLEEAEKDLLMQWVVLAFSPAAEAAIKLK